MTPNAYLAGAFLAAGLGLAHPASAGELRAAPATTKVAAAYDLISATVKARKAWLEFTIRVKGRIGGEVPAKTGKVPGARVIAYVWPTKLDPATVGFESGAGILAFTVTAHPDFDDTPLFDENADGDRDNDGAGFHSHWVVLVPDDACGKGALKVRDIPKGARPPLPATWPGLPILIDSPGYSPRIRGGSVTVRVPMKDLTATRGVAFDGVVAGLRVNANLHDPFLCVTDVFRVASGDLSLPGRID